MQKGLACRKTFRIFGVREKKMNKDERERNNSVHDRGMYVL